MSDLNQAGIAKQLVEFPKKSSILSKNKIPELLRGQNITLFSTHKHVIVRNN